MQAPFRTLGLLASLMVLAPALPASPGPQDEGGEQKEAEPSDSGAEAKKEDEEEEPPSWFALVGGDVHTGTGSVLRGATVLSKDGKIVEIGYELDQPEETEVLDVTGFRVYPGLVAVNSFGLFGGASDLANSFDPYNRNMVLALASGITTAFSGGEVAKLKYGELEGVVLGSAPWIELSYGTSNPSAKRSTREKLEQAAEYLRQYRQWEIDKRTDKDLKEPSKSKVDESVVRVLRGEARAVFSAEGRTDLLEIANLAQRFGFRPVIRGCREGWTVADALGRAGASAVLTPRDRRPKSEEFVHEGGSSIENAALLYRAGVPVTIIPSSAGISLGGIVGRDLMALPIEAGFAIRGGLPEPAAFAGITIEPARLLGVDHRVGTLEVGKDADMIVTDGDVLHYETFVQWTIVDGKVVYDKQAELYFAHIRPRPASALAPETREEAPVEPPTAPDGPEQPEDGGGADPGGEGDGGAR